MRDIDAHPPVIGEYYENRNKRLQERVKTWLMIIHEDIFR
jgi:hypothetical protein